MLILMAAASLLLAETTPAVDPAKPAAAEATAEKPKKPKVVCVDEEQMGSLFKKRVCRTPEQVEAERLKAERDKRAMSDHYAVCRVNNC